MISAEKSIFLPQQPMIFTRYRYGQAAIWLQTGSGQVRGVAQKYLQEQKMSKSRVKEGKKE